MRMVSAHVHYMHASSASNYSVIFSCERTKSRERLADNKVDPKYNYNKKYVYVQFSIKYV